MTSNTSPSIAIRPYPGLRPFLSDEGNLFFGRDRQSLRMITILARQHFLAVVGTSGCGKSSLVKAGLLPELANPNTRVGDSDRPWVSVVARPGGGPYRNLAAELAKRCPESEASVDPAQVEQRLRAGIDGLIDAIYSVPGMASRNVLVVIDQFEEIFRFEDTSQRRIGELERTHLHDDALAFVDMLLAAVEARNPQVFVAITMRSDSLGRCDLFHGLPEAITRSQFLPPRMTKEQLLDAIRRPLEQFKSTIEDADVSDLLESMGDRQDQLPVVQHALAQLWFYASEGKQPGEPRHITTAHADRCRSGSNANTRIAPRLAWVTDAITTHADAVFDGLRHSLIGEDLPEHEADERQRIARAMFCALSQIDNNQEPERRLTSIDEVARIVFGSEPTDAQAAQTESVAEAFAEEGHNFIFRSKTAGGFDVLDISHESFLRQWGRLRVWIDAEAKSARNYLQLLDAVERGEPYLSDLHRKQAKEWLLTADPNEFWAMRYDGAAVASESTFQVCRELIDRSYLKYLNESGTWEQWFRRFQLEAKRQPSDEGFADILELPKSVREQKWAPTSADRNAAWELYTELRTRITTQSLDSIEGNEPTALESVNALFATSRDLMRKHGREAQHYATLVAFFLNRILRPFTARWHREITSGNLRNDDVRHLFREELRTLQGKTRLFGSAMGRLAEGDTEFKADSESWPEAEVAPTLGEAAETEQFSWSQRVDLGVPIPFDRLLFDAAVTDEKRVAILKAERNEVRDRRNVMAQTTGDVPQNLAGLALSGGGLRSATFALGVVQTLAEKNMLGQFDYLSTVSGGGYLGTFLSSYLNSPADPRWEASATAGPRDPEVGPNADCFPFKKPVVGESAALWHLRSQSKFLLNGGTLGRFRMVLQALFGELTNVAIVFPWIAIVVLLACFSMKSDIHRAVFHHDYNYISDVFSHFGQQIITSGLILFLVLLPIVVRGARRNSVVKLGTAYLWLASGWLVLFFAVIAWNSIPVLFRGIDHVGRFFMDTKWLPDVLKSEWAVPGGLAALHAVGRLVGVAGRQKPWTVVLKKLITRIAGPLFLLAVFVLLGRAVILGDDQPVLEFMMMDTRWSFTRSEVLLGITLAFLIYDHLFLDINLSSLHPFYRDRLGEAYLVQRRKTKGGTDDGQKVDQTKLSELRRTRDSRAPYHLLNAALNVPSSRHPALRGRHYDFFLFSKHFCGSAATSYYATTEFEFLDPALNLGTAMAISGAAASHFMGTGSGETSFLLAWFNIRLDYWLRCPGRLALPPFSWKPGPWYLAKQLLGQVDERSSYINLSNGGDIENLAIYELLRRRCKFIVAVDGECDPRITCGSLLTLIDYAKIDFGIEVKFDYVGGLDRLKPTSTQGGSVVRSPILPYHFALARIEYPAETPNGPKLLGWLLYLKSSLTGNEEPTISYYRSKYPAFPHESTADLFFDEEQFEAYRSLGHHIADDAFRPEITGQSQSPKSIREWFETLKDKMTKPNAL